jgi:hypothetical protein
VIGSVRVFWPPSSHLSTFDNLHVLTLLGLYFGFPSPHKPPAILIYRKVRKKQFVLQICLRFVIKRELSSESPIGVFTWLLEERHSLFDRLIECHHQPSTAASTAVVFGSQYVISISLYISRAVDSSVRACSA